MPTIDQTKSLSRLLSILYNEVFQTEERNPNKPQNVGSHLPEQQEMTDDIPKHYFWHQDREFKWGPEGGPNPESGDAGPIAGYGEFVGSGDGRISVATYSAVNNLWQSGAATAEFWVRADSDGALNTGVIISKGPWFIGVSNEGSGGVKLDFGHDVWLFRSVDPFLRLGSWFHVAICWDGTSPSTVPVIYRNGQALNMTTVVTGSTVNTDTADVYIANKDNVELPFSQQFDGGIDDVRLWDDARTQAEIQANIYTELAGNESNLVLYMPINERSGTSINNLVSGSNNGILDTTNASLEIQKYVARWGEYGIWR